MNKQTTNSSKWLFLLLFMFTIPCTFAQKMDDQLLDSFAIITLVSELEDAFDISIEASEMMPVNFNSAKAIWAMVQRLQED